MLSATALLRADEPYPRPATAGPFPWVDLRLGGLRPAMWILLAYLFVMVTTVDEEWAAIGRLQPTLLLGALLTAACLAEVLAHGLTRTQRGLLRTAPGVWWAALLVASIFSTIWAYDIRLALKAESELFLTLLGFPVLVLLVRTRREVVLVCLTVVAGHAFYLARSFSEFLNGRIVGASDLARMVGAGQSNADPNAFAATIVFSLPLVLWVALHARWRSLRLGCAAYGAVGAYCIVMTRSRAGLVMLALVAVWALLIVPSRRVRLMIGAGLLAFGLLLAQRLSSEELERYESIVASSTYSQEESTRGRVDGYRVGLLILQEKPLFGIGPGNWSRYRVNQVDGKALMPHALAGQLFADLGGVGTIAFLGYVLASFAFGLRQRRRLRASPDPWDRAVHSLLGALLVVLGLLLVSGLAAHNLGREGWALAPALMIAAVGCRKGVLREESHAA